MTFEVPFNVDEKVIHPTNDEPFNLGEIFVLKPDQIYSLKGAKEYLKSISQKVDELEQSTVQEA